uniref:Uncharacterized protein n=1 Tax=Cacopsylla melanoneura TaxID=428564 RepID=A0A8D8TE80_9HEMI
MTGVIYSGSSKNPSSCVEARNCSHGASGCILTVIQPMTGVIYSGSSKNPSSCVEGRNCSHGASCFITKVSSSSLSEHFSSVESHVSWKKRKENTHAYLYSLNRTK